MNSVRYWADANVANNTTQHNTNYSVSHTAIMSYNHTTIMSYSGYELIYGI